jgi:flavocytochrome c
MAWDEAADVVVVGGGFAGLAAAIEARSAGASVIILEKMHACGGNSIISAGGIAAAGTEMQRQRGIEDSPQVMAEDMMAAGLGLNHPDLVRTVAERANEAFEWTIDVLGVQYLDRVDIFGGHSVPRCYATHNDSGSAIIKPQLAKLRELGIEPRTHVLLEDLVLDKQGTVRGVRVREGYRYPRRDSGQPRAIGAEKAVVLASGGFGADVRFRRAQDPRLTATIDTTNKRSSTAEVLLQALRLGAAPVHLSHIQLGPWTSPDERGYGAGPFFSDYIAFPLGLVVHPETGRRFVNELADRKKLADSILQVGHPCIAVADATAVAQSGYSIERALRKGVVQPFDSLRGLAAAYGLPPQALEEAVARFNRGVERGTDEDFGKPVMPAARPLECPPFYGMRLWPKVHYTMGGIRIDTSARVIDLEGVPIPRLYAAGEITGGVHGACRLGSCAITDCLVFGRIAGLNGASGLV